MGMKHMEHMDTMARALLEQEGKNPRPTGTTAGSGGGSEALSAADRLPGQTGRLRESHAVPVVGRRHRALARLDGGSAELVRIRTCVRARRREGGVDARAVRARAGYANVAEFLRQYSEAGGKVLAATDAGCCTQIVPGLSLHYEMQMLTDIGIPPMKAIQGATLWAAEVIGQAEISAASSRASSPTSPSSKAIRWPTSARRRTCARSSKTVK